MGISKRLALYLLLPATYIIILIVTYFLGSINDVIFVGYGLFNIFILTTFNSLIGFIREFFGSNIVKNQDDLTALLKHKYSKYQHLLTLFYFPALGILSLIVILIQTSSSFPIVFQFIGAGISIFLVIVSFFRLLIILDNNIEKAIKKEKRNFWLNQIDFVIIFGGNGFLCLGIFSKFLDFSMETAGVILFFNNSIILLAVCVKIFEIKNMQRLFFSLEELQSGLEELNQVETGERNFSQRISQLKEEYEKNIENLQKRNIIESPSHYLEWISAKVGSLPVIYQENWNKLYTKILTTVIIGTISAIILNLATLPIEESNVILFNIIILILITILLIMIFNRQRRYPTKSKPRVVFDLAMCISLGLIIGISLTQKFSMTSILSDYPYLKIVSIIFLICYFVWILFIAFENPKMSRREFRDLLDSLLSITWGFLFFQDKNSLFLTFLIVLLSTMIFFLFLNYTVSAQNENVTPIELESLCDQIGKVLRSIKRPRQSSGKIKKINAEFVKEQLFEYFKENQVYSLESKEEESTKVSDIFFKLTMAIKNPYERLPDKIQYSIIMWDPSQNVFYDEILKMPPKQDIGIVIVINLSKISITPTYENRVLNHKTYVRGSFLKSPFSAVKFDHFMSKHEINTCITKITLVHLIFNMVYPNIPNIY